jgi:cytochrome c oxidase subunit 2
MRSYAIVMSRPAFQRWASRQGQQQSGGGVSAGASLFRENGCGSCHTFEPANATAKVGPDLGNLPQYAKRAGKPLDAFVRESIQDPSAYVEKGFPANTMPSFSQLSGQQLDVLVQYLTQSSSARNSGSGG